MKMAVIGKIEGVREEVLRRLATISEAIGKDLEVTSGKRDGDVNSSTHHSGIAVDVKAQDLDSGQMAELLLLEGFSGIGEYFDTQGNPFAFAHGDIRGLPGSENSGDYASGGSKAVALCWWREGTAVDGTYEWGRCKSGLVCDQTHAYAAVLETSDLVTKEYSEVELDYPSERSIR